MRLTYPLRNNNIDIYTYAQTTDIMPCKHLILKLLFVCVYICVYVNPLTIIIIIIIN